MAVYNDSLWTASYMHLSSFMQWDVQMKLELSSNRDIEARRQLSRSSSPKLHRCPVIQLGRPPVSSLRGVTVPTSCARIRRKRINSTLGTILYFVGPWAFSPSTSSSPTLLLYHYIALRRGQDRQGRTAVTLRWPSHLVNKRTSPPRTPGLQL